MPPITGDSSAQAVPAILASNTGGGSGVRSLSNDGRAIEGWSTTNYGVTGDSNKFPGVRGTSVTGRGVEGWSTSAEGIFGTSQTGNAIMGTTDGAGVGVFGASKNYIGVQGNSHDPNNAGVMGVNDNGGWGVTGRSA